MMKESNRASAQIWIWNRPRNVEPPSWVDIWVAEIWQ